eukprot:TRINITY_DN3789_c0_g1_i1.p1 TRINITY_DN3789_c0_g1~~TRINITY_DN3789_c0_g1_i1.p1  ORF type:complete len:455 (+),score=109.11 TRINITY_DN3789_c0_g1_i1:64-1428(+)
MCIRDRWYQRRVHGGIIIMLGQFQRRIASTSLSRGFASGVPIHTRIAVIGGGSAGLGVAAQLARKNNILRHDIRIFEPSKIHHYQPAYTMIGGGLANPKEAVRLTLGLIPKGIAVTPFAITSIDAQNNILTATDGSTYSYDQLVIAPGVRLDFDAVKGLREALNDDNEPVATIWDFRSAQKYSALRSGFGGGRAIFTSPIPPIKCLGAAQKIMYLSHDSWTRGRPVPKLSVNFFNAGPVLFPVKDYSEALTKLVNEKGINVNFGENLVEVRKGRVAVFENVNTKLKREEPFDILHVVPPHKPQEFLKQTPNLTDKAGYVDVDAGTLRHKVYPNIWSLGDTSNLPTSKTIAAITSQIPVLVENLSRVLEHRQEKNFVQYDGYTSCPIFVGNDKLMLCEFVYNCVRKETFSPFINQTKPNRLFFFLKRKIFPLVYWNLYNRGLWYGSRGIIPPRFS